MSQCRKRVLLDYKRLKTQKETTGVYAQPSSDMFKWHAAIIGPSKTVWDGAILPLSIEYPKDYPMKPPKIKFVTKVFHPNIYPDGKICLDLLQNEWVSSYDIVAVLIAIQSLLTEPNCSSPANCEAARLYEHDREEYDRRVMKCAEDTWTTHFGSLFEGEK
ncbi:ubiquitin-conjugating enzyme E2 2 [Aduncisulcus paluster]|uniref:Ubiquitin-conjugating enzyme E2 2 n=1 Tax=Aduncisulcus paluster TaxID=2918883 RepID=A0ABQ5K596_9EUKA|nr:ubiquitin-conjugating enzyme E2 2 [Aduncisulcus paluster]